MSDGARTGRFAFTGGGTAGHVVPALPVARALRASGHTVLWIGSRSGLEARLVQGQVDGYHGIAAGKLRRYWSWQNLRDAFAVLAGILQALWLVPRLRLDAVFSKGGFVSFPVVFAAWVWRVPVVAHESDRSPGLANRLAYPFIQALCTNFPEVPTRFDGPVEHTGTPLRQQLLDGDAERGRAFLFPDVAADAPPLPLLLITGGSLGADRLNAAVADAIEPLCSRYRVAHVCGPGKVPAGNLPGGDLLANYRALEFVTDAWGDVLAAADLVVSRAGANALFELLELRKPTLFVPLSLAASRGDQIENAAYARDQGLAEVLSEAELTTDTLIAGIDTLAARAPQLRAALGQLERPDATQRIVTMLVNCAAL